MRRWKTVTIIGVGLIGGSIGLALRARGLAENVIGVGRRSTSLRAARRAGAVTATTLNLAKGVAKADLIVVCSPVGHIVSHVCEAAEYCPEGTLITDAGSTKQEIAAALDGKLPRGVRFLGSHPLAGSEKTGPGNATADLFEGRVAIVTPTRNTHAEDFDLLEQFWTELGSVVVKMTPEAHDEALALTSHLPHAVAAAMATALPESYFRLVGTGMLDTTRIAAGDPDLWTQIFLANRRNVLAALEAFSRQLTALAGSLEAGDALALQEFLARGKKNRDALGS